jgi:hypothetical protein
MNPPVGVDHPDEHLGPAEVDPDRLACAQRRGLLSREPMRQY